MPFIDRSPLESPINTAVSLRRWKDTRAPTVADYKQFKEGDFWLHSNVALGDTTWYICAYKDASSAIWEQFASTTGTENFLTDDGLPAVEPDVTGQIDILGGEGIDVTGTGPGNIITVAGEDATITNKGIGELSTDLETIDGTQTDNHFINPSSLKAKLGVQTAKAIPYGAGTAAAIAWTGALADGELIIGSTAGVPATANILSAGGTVTVTNSANAINLEAGGGVPTTFTTDAGNAVPALNILDVLGGNNISTAGALNDVTINLTGTTASCVQVGNAGGSLTSIGAALTGELLIGNTGADPAFGSTAYGDFAFSQLGVGVPRTFSVNNTDDNVASTANIMVSVPDGGADGFVSWEIMGTRFYSMGPDNSIANDPLKITNSSNPSAGTALLTLKTGGDITFNEAYEFPVADGNAGDIFVTDGAGNIDWGTSTSALADLDNIIYVGKHGNDANDGKNPFAAKLTIQAGVTAAVAGDTIIVYPGTYTETVTHAASNVTLRAEGKPTNVIITQADANVIDFATYTGIQYKYFGISCTAATTAINTVEGSTGGCTFKECQLEMTCATDIAAAIQPSVGSITGAGALKVTIGKVTYAHTGNGGATAQKGAFRVADGGTVTLQRINDLSVSCSGTALVTGVGIDTASTGVFELNDNKITVTDPNSTIVTGLAYLSGTGAEHEFFRNTVHVVTTNNTAYGFFSADTATTSRFFYNHLHVTDTAGASYSFLIGNGATVISHFDDLIADDGHSLVAGGTFTEVSSEMDGSLTASDTVNATTFDTNIAAAGVTLAGTTLEADGTDANIPINFIPKGTSGLEVDKASGDSFIHFTSGVGDGVFVGLDESDGKRFKMGNGADPSASAFFWQDPSSGWMWFLGTQAGTSAAEWHFEASNAGQTNRLYVANDDNTNVASNASIGAWTPSGGGDCFTQWRVASVKSYSMGIDQSDANSLKITYDSAGGPCISPSSGVEFLKFTTAGAMTINEAYTFPTADGSADQVLTTDGSGAVTWEDGGGSSGDTVQTLTDAASIAWNITSGEIGIVTLGGNRALANPTNIVAGGRYTLIAKQDGTGSRTLSYGTYFKFPGAVTPVLTTNASAVDMVEFIAESTILLRCVNVIYDSK